MMKLAFVSLLVLSAAAALAKESPCKRCDEIAALEAKVKEELPKDEPDTGALDVEAAKIINSLGTFNDAQAKQVVSYLRYTLPADPSRSMIESVWPAISKNRVILEKAASSLPEADKATVMDAILHHEDALKNKQDSPKSSPPPAKPK